MTANGAGAIHFKFWNSLSAFLHAKRISCILILPWTSSNKIDHKSVCNLHILKHYLAKDINASRPQSSPERLEDLFLYMVCLPGKAWRYHFVEQPLSEDLGSLLIQESSTLAVVLEKKLWTRIGKPLGNVKEFTGLEPLLPMFHTQPTLGSSCPLASTLCKSCAPFLGHTVRLWRTGKDLGTGISQKAEGMEGGMVAVGLQHPLHSGRPCHVRELALPGSEAA